MAIINISNINFLAKRRVEIFLKAKRLYIIQAVSVAILGIYFVFIFGIFAYSTFLNLSDTKIKNNITERKKNIQGMSETESRYYAVQSKVANTKKVIGSLQKHQAIIETIFKIIPEGISINGFAIDEGGDISFSASTTDGEKMRGFIDTLEKRVLSDRASVSKASISQVGVDKDGNYSFGTIIKLAVD